MKLSGSTKFIACVLALILAVVLGWKGYALYRLKGVVLDEITPGRVNIVAVAPAAGYRIIVANQIAYLAEVSGDFGGGDVEERSDSVTTKSRLPLRELLETLQGNEESLGVLIMRLNEWPDLDTVRGAKVWKSEDIQKAVDGDLELESQLSKDLNVTLEGVPLDVINLDAIMEGIIIDSPVQMEVNVGGEVRTLTARVRENFLPRFCVNVNERIRERVPGRDEIAYLQGVYAELARPIIKAGKGDDVRGALLNRIAPRRLQGLTEKPAQVLNNTSILLNDQHVTTATYTSYAVGNGQEACDVSIGLTDTGRMRLWKYSHDNRGFQLLFIVDSVAIAAPRITTELAERNVTIRRVPSKDLVADAVELLNEIIKDNKS